MINLVKTHPFNVTAFFENSTVLTFAVPKEELENKIPDNLELETFNNKWGFVAVAMVQTKNLKPEKLPDFFGSDFFLIGYRIFVRYKSKKGKIYRGLYVIKSETDKLKMKLLGNTFTHYHYTKTDVKIIKTESGFQVKSNQTGLYVEWLDKKSDLPLKSPFKNWKDARKFAGPLPFSFSFQGNKKMIIIEGKRSNWKPQPIEVINYNIPFLKELKIKNYVLANAFTIKNIPYKWKKGKIISL